MTFLDQPPALVASILSLSQRPPIVQEAKCQLTGSTLATVLTSGNLSLSATPKTLNKRPNVHLHPRSLLGLKEGCWHLGWLYQGASTPWKPFRRCQWWSMSPESALSCPGISGSLNREPNWATLAWSASLFKQTTQASQVLAWMPARGSHRAWVDLTLFPPAPDSQHCCPVYFRPFIELRAQSFLKYVILVYSGSALSPRGGNPIQ